MTTDRDLLARYLDQADQSAFAALVDRHVHFVHATARRQCPADADDVTQAVFILLARRAATVRGQASVAGWLHRATGYCCANARKLDARRRQHEHEAAMRRTHEHPATDPAHAAAPADDDLLPALDRALTSLPARYREAVILRYLQGRSVEETGHALGLSAVATRKRASRGLEQLRDYFARRGPAVPLAVVAATLAAQAELRATDAVVAATTAARAATASAQAATAAAPSAVTAAPAAAIADLTAPSLASPPPPAALAAAVAALVGVVAALAAVMSAATDPAPAAVPTAPPTTAAAVDVVAGAPEANLPGRTVVARFDVLLDAPATAAAVLAATSPVTDATATFFTVRRGPADAVLAALRQADADGRIVIADRQMTHSVRPSGWPAGHPLPIHLPQFWDDFRRGSQQFSLGLTWGSSDAATVDDAPRGVQLRLRDPDVTTFLQEYSVEPRERRNGRTSIDYTSVLAPGDAIVLLADWQMRGQHFVSASVFHAYRATDAQYERTRRIRPAATWVRLGPTGARALADRAIAWGGEGNFTPDKTPARWTRVLPNGATVRLLAVARPRSWPLCWWDADGRPAPRDWTELTIPFDAPAAVAVSVEMSKGPDVAAHGLFWSDLGQAYALPEGDRQVTVWVGAGPWQEARIAIGDELDLGDGHVRLERVTGSRMLIPLLRGELGHDVEVYVDAVTKGGQRVSPHDPGRAVRVVTSQTRRWESMSENLSVAADEVDHYVLRWRWRERAVFEDFAATPTPEPPPLP